MNVDSSIKTNSGRVTSTANGPVEAAPKPAEIETTENPPKDSFQLSDALAVAGKATDFGGKTLKHAARAIPGALNVAYNSPNLLVSPLLNSFSPATNNKDAIFYERWSNVLGGTVIGGVAGVAAAMLLGDNLPVSTIVGLGFAGAGSGLAASALRIGASAAFAKKDGTGYHARELAKYPQIGNAAYQAKSSSSNRSYATGAAIRSGYASGVKEAYEDGAYVVDQLGSFTKGLVGIKE